MIRRKEESVKNDKQVFEKFDQFEFSDDDKSCHYYFRQHLIHIPDLTRNIDVSVCVPINNIIQLCTYECIKFFCLFIL